MPNAETIAAIRENDEGRGKHFDNVETLIADLNADDRTFIRIQKTG